MLFAVLFLLCSPIIQSAYARKFRKDALLISIIISVILTVGSFFAYFLGINVRIGANCIVVKDVPGNCVVVTKGTCVIKKEMQLDNTYIDNK